MCLNEARGQARLNDIGRQENMCSGASNGDSSGRHDGSIIREEKGKTKTSVEFYDNDVLALHGGVLR